MKYTAAIFDMDGTILNTLEDLNNSVNYALKENGYPLITMEELRHHVGNGIKNMLRESLPKGSSEEEVEKIYEIFLPYYREHNADITKPYEGIREAIAELKAAGIKTAVVSNKADKAVKELCARFFNGLFDVCLGENESEGVKRKPAPDMVYMALDVIGTKASDAVYIGDSDVDLATARNAGLDCIAVTWGFRSEEVLREHGAVTFAHEPKELTKYFL